MCIKLGRWSILDDNEMLTVVIVALVLITLLVVLQGCATRVEVDEPGDWGSIYIGTVTFIDSGMEYKVKLYRARIDEEALRVYIAFSPGSQGMGVAVIPQ